MFLSGVEPKEKKQMFQGGMLISVFVKQLSRNRKVTSKYSLELSFGDGSSDNRVLRGQIVQKFFRNFASLIISKQQYNTVFENHIKCRI